ncbi:MAG: hypothetical protein ACR2QJ_16965 [Geminicoccaceae bacterium]
MKDHRTYSGVNPFFNIIGQISGVLADTVAEVQADRVIDSHRSAMIFVGRSTFQDHHAARDDDRSNECMNVQQPENRISACALPMESMRG